MKSLEDKGGGVKDQKKYTSTHLCLRIHASYGELRSAGHGGGGRTETQGDVIE